MQIAKKSQLKLQKFFKFFIFSFKLPLTIELFILNLINFLVKILIVYSCNINNFIRKDNNNPLLSLDNYQYLYAKLDFLY